MSQLAVNTQVLFSNIEIIRAMRPKQHGHELTGEQWARKAAAPSAAQMGYWARCGEVAVVASQETGRARWQPISIAICGLMVVATVAFAVASIIHFGMVIAIGPITIDDPFPGAAIPEAIIAVVLGIGSLSVLAHWPGRWGTALAATLFALIATLYGLTVTVGSARTGDIMYHVTVLVLSVVIAGMLLLPAGRHALSG